MSLDDEKNALLVYYRNLADTFEKERLDLIRKIDHIDVHRSELQKAQLEIAKRNDQIVQLQSALSDAHLYLFDERDHLLKLTSENDELRVRDYENRQRIQDLLALTKPVTQEVTYFRDAKPKVFSRPSGPVTDQNQPGNVIRTIYLSSNKSVEHLEAIIESLKQRLIETEKLNDERERARRQDRNIRIQESKAAAAEYAAALRTLEEKVTSLSSSNRDILKEHLIMRYEFQQERRRLMEDIEKSRECAKDAVDQLNNCRFEMEKTIEGIRNKEASHSADITAEFRRQAMDKEEALTLVREQAFVTQRLYEQKIAAIEEANSKLLKKYRALERRRALDLEGKRRDKQLHGDKKALEYFQQIQSC